MYKIKKFKADGTYLKTEGTPTLERAQRMARQFEERGFIAEIEMNTDVYPGSGVHPVALGSGDPGVRRSVLGEAHLAESNDLDEQFWNRDA